MPEKMAKRVATIDVGLPCEIAEVLPVRRYPEKKASVEGKEEAG